MLLMTGGPGIIPSRSRGRLPSGCCVPYDFDQLFIGRRRHRSRNGTTTFNELLGLSRVMAEVAREVIVMAKADRVGRRILTRNCLGSIHTPDYRRAPGIFRARTR